MDYKPLTSERKDDILNRNGETVLKRINIEPLIMSEFVAEAVMDAYQSQEIQEEQTQGQKRNELLKHLMAASLEQFVRFCLVLVEKRNRTDIVCDVFGLRIKDLEIQRDEAIREKRKQQEGSALASISTEAQGGEQMSKSEDEVDTSLIEMMESAPSVPHHELSGMASTDNKGSAIASMSADIPQMKDFKMIHDPPGEKEVNSIELNPIWMAPQFKRLRESLVGKPHKPVVIALLDTGVFTDHPDLKNLIEESRSCIGRKERGRFIHDDVEKKDLTRDKANHGTMSAGIVWQYAGEENVKILNLKVLKSDGHGSYEYISEALNYIKEWDAKRPDMQVDIVLMTFGGGKSDRTTNDLLSELGGKKILVCSASNDGQTKANSIPSPANHGSVIPIGSCNSDGGRCSHSSVGQELAFLFPGENIVSTSSMCRFWKLNHRRYIRKSGTSFAAPHSAALMALVLCYVETHITNLAGKSGNEWRKDLTTSHEMKKLLSDVCVRQDHSVSKGFGAPEIDRITVDAILAYLKLAFNIPN